MSILSSSQSQSQTLSSSSSSSLFSSCEFSEPIAATSSFFSSSLSSSITDLGSNDPSNPSPTILLSVSGTRLTIRDGNSLQINQIFTCVDKIDFVSLSPDRKYILCAMFARGLIELFSLSDTSWTGRIHEGIGAGLILAAWTPDSKHVLTQSDFGIQICIWSLVNSSSVIISNPKNLDSIIDNTGAVSRSYAFSDCGKYLAILHRLELQDYVGVYSTNPWEELTKFRSQTTDACSIQWLPKGLHIIVTDSPIHYKVNIFSPAGQLLSSLEAYEHALGVRSIAFQRSYERNLSKATSLMAVASFDGKIRLLSTKSWQVAFVLSCTHPRDMESTTLSNKENNLGYMLVEESTWISNIDEGFVADQSMNMSMNMSMKSFSMKTTTQSIKSSRQPSSYGTRNLKSLPHMTIDPLKSKGHISMGVHWTAFHADGIYLAAREESYPRCLWIWDMTEIKLVHIVVQLEAILDAAWRPTRSSIPILAFCCGSARIYLWSLKEGVSWSDIPTTLAPFSVTSIYWSEDGSQLILAGKEVFCTCTLNFDSSDMNFTAQKNIIV